MHSKPKNTIWKQPWFLRRILYLILSAVGTILIGVGIAEETQIDTWIDQVKQIAEVFFVVGLGFAATKANPGSDSNATEEDIIRADKAESRLDKVLDEREVLQRVNEKLETPLSSGVTSETLHDQLVAAQRTESKLDDLLVMIKMGAEARSSSVKPSTLSLEELRSRIK